MADEQKPETQGGSKFHYYSGGEIKEQAGTKVSPTLWVFWSVLIVAGLAYFIFGGAMGPNSHFGGFKPGDATQSNLNTIQQQLNTREATSGVRYASVNLNALPVPQGQTISQAVAQGSEVYQTYCIGCHGPNQDGNGVNAGSLYPKPRNLRDAPFMQAMSYQRITTSLHKGVPGTAMPRWENTLTETQIGDVIAYVFSLTSPTGPSAIGNAASGGSSEFVSGTQSSPKPITPAIGGNPAASTKTAPPSLSGPTPDQVNAQLNGADGSTAIGAPPTPKKMTPATSAPGSSTSGGAAGAGSPSAATGTGSTSGGM